MSGSVQYSTKISLWQDCGLEIVLYQQGECTRRNKNVDSIFRFRIKADKAEHSRRRRIWRMQSTFEKIYDVVRQIPYGQVATYGQVAALAGNKRWARVVGYALHVNPDPDNIPCYRVVNKEGKVSDTFAFGGGNRQEKLLQAEGVEFVNGCVDMKRYQWQRPIY